MAVQELENAFTRLVGEFTNGRGAGEALAGAISGVANVMDGLSDNAELLGTALDAVMVTAGPAERWRPSPALTTTWLSNAAASRAAAIAAAQKATADEGAAVAAQRAAAQELQRAKAAVASAEAEVAASRARQAASLQNLRDVQAALSRSARWSRPGFRRRSPTLVGSSPSLAWLSYGCPKRPLSGRSRPQRRRSHPRRWRLRPPSPPPISAGPPQSRQPLRHNRL
ncbi:hypothetical protein [Pseudomonas aeruginosa]|uniref:hypothetical protein n=1 Tax=Pseudomonas aeruginosa TaxID=287 RepID=UPI001ADB4A52|nr:hypothetical protein [Pseudomonas aeruginosa]MBO8381578.1 hypothetical protein [Pseudomonas aeruginosa]